MAIVNCPHCSARTSDRAPTCSGCGWPTGPSAASETPPSPAGAPISAASDTVSLPSPRNGKKSKPRDTVVVVASVLVGLAFVILVCIGFYRKGLAEGAAKREAEPIARVAPIHSATPVDPLSGNLAGLYRSMKDVEAATTTGVTYARLGELLERSTAEMSIANDRPLTPDEKQAVGAYSVALGVYAISMKIWKTGIDSGQENAMILVADDRNADVRDVAETFELSYTDVDRVIKYTDADRLQAAIHKASRGMVWPRAAWIFGATAASEIWPRAQEFVTRAENDFLRR